MICWGTSNRDGTRMACRWRASAGSGFHVMGFHGWRRVKTSASPGMRFRSTLCGKKTMVMFSCASACACEYKS
eukprot:scaffold43478_cov63-Phaeocystis_antarctica.AAC.2